MRKFSVETQTILIRIIVLIKINRTTEMVRKGWALGSFSLIAPQIKVMIRERRLQGRDSSILSLLIINQQLLNNRVLLKERSSALSKLFQKVV